MCVCAYELKRKQRIHRNRSDLVKVKAVVFGFIIVMEVRNRDVQFIYCDSVVVCVDYKK